MDYARLRRCATTSKDFVDEYKSRLNQMLDNEKKLCLHKKDQRNISLSKCSPFQSWRDRVVQWYYDLTDSLGEARSVAYIAMSILDRYCIHTASSEALDQKAYELASMCALLLAIRLKGGVRLSIDDWLSMSRFGQTKTDFHRIGKSMAQYMKHAFPIIAPFDFVKELLFLCTKEVNPEELNMIFNESAFLCEVCVVDSIFTHIRPSHVAVAAIKLSIRHISVAKSNKVISIIEKATSLQTESLQFRKVCDRLDDVCDRQQIDTCRPNVIYCEGLDEHDTTILQNGLPPQHGSNLVHVVSTDDLGQGILSAA